jgi:hypothetical protein
MPVATADGPNLPWWKILNDLYNLVKPEARQWILVAHGKSLALRNIDHLVPPDGPGPYGPPVVDFYWAGAGKDGFSNSAATPGLWAVRGEHLSLVLERWKEALSEVGAHGASEEEVWTRVVQQLPLKKLAFEKGEVVAPRIGAVDWEAVSNAAFVTVPDWPEKEAWKFLQGKRSTEHLSHFRERSRISGSYAAAVSWAMAGAPWAFNQAAGSRSGSSSGAGSCISLPKTHSR